MASATVVSPSTKYEQPGAGSDRFLEGCSVVYDLARYLALARFSFMAYMRTFSRSLRAIIRIVLGHVTLSSKSFSSRLDLRLTVLTFGRVNASTMTGDILLVSCFDLSQTGVSPTLFL